MQFFMLIPNIILILHEDQVLVVKISKYESNLATDFEKIDFFSKGTTFFKTHANIFPLSFGGLNDVWKLEECFETKDYIGLGEQGVTVSSDRPSRAYWRRQERWNILKPTQFYSHFDAESE